jgi:hypothetical protein
MGSRRRGDEPRRRLGGGASGPERAPVSANVLRCGGRRPESNAAPACRDHSSGRERRVRNRGAGDEDTCVRQMRNWLRSLQHTRHPRPVKPGERHARNAVSTLSSRVLKTRLSSPPQYVATSSTNRVQNCPVSGSAVATQPIRSAAIPAMMPWARSWLPRSSREWREHE